MSTKIVNKFTMVTVAVSDMKKAKEFYADKLGLEVKTDYRVSDDNWWVTLTFPDGGSNLTLARTTAVKATIQPGALSIYFSTSEIAAAHKELDEKGLKTGEVTDDLYGPGSGVKFFQLADPDGNQVTFAEE